MAEERGGTSRSSHIFIFNSILMLLLQENKTGEKIVSFVETRDKATD